MQEKNGIERWCILIQRAFTRGVATNFVSIRVRMNYLGLSISSTDEDHSRSDANSKLRRGGFHPQRDGKMLIGYLLDSEVHTFAFSFAANAILSFIPLIVMLYTLAGSVFHSAAMSAEIAEMIKYFLPSNQDFVAQNLAFVASRHSYQYAITFHAPAGWSHSGCYCRQKFHASVVRCMLV